MRGADESLSTTGAQFPACAQVARGGAVSLTELTKGEVQGNSRAAGVTRCAATLSGEVGEAGRLSVKVDAQAFGKVHLFGEGWGAGGSA